MATLADVSLVAVAVQSHKSQYHESAEGSNKEACRALGVLVKGVHGHGQTVMDSIEGERNPTTRICSESTNLRQTQHDTINE